MKTFAAKGELNRYCGRKRGGLTLLSFGCILCSNHCASTTSGGKKKFTEAGVLSYCSVSGTDYPIMFCKMSIEVLKFSGAYRMPYRALQSNEQSVSVKSIFM